MDVAIVGDGPGGLSAALLLAKNGMSVHVYGQDETAMHWALLRNYLGIPDQLGSEFQQFSRQQVQRWGTVLEDRHVDGVRRAEAGFQIALQGGEQVTARYLILSEGKGPRLARELGLEFDGARLVTNRDGETSLPGVYAVGRSVRPGRSQAIISAGDGAAAALDILSKEKGQDFSDWDSAPKS